MIKDKIKKNDLKDKELFSDTLKNAIQESDIEQIKTEVNRLKELDYSKVKIEKSKINLDKVKSFYDLFSLLKANMNANTLDSETSDITEVSKDLSRYMNKGVVAFVFYIWNPENLNIKIIPRLTGSPILDLVKMKEMYFLYKPSLFIDGIPIYIVVKNIPFSFELKFITKENLEKVIELRIPTATEVKAILKSMFTTYLLGKPMISLNQFLYIIFLITTLMLIEYIVLSTIWLGV